MPPKAKFTREEIVTAALDIVRENGLEGLTARALGAKLGSSARPIFTVFQDMDEVKRDVVAALRNLYTDYVDKGLGQKEMPEFKGVGMAYIQFAIKEPKFFQIMFMSEQEKKPTVMNVLPIIDENYEKILSSVQNCYAVSTSEAEWLYRHLWIYTHGIAVLCATNMCTFTIERIGTMLTEVCIAMLKELKKGEKND